MAFKCKRRDMAATGVAFALALVGQVAGGYNYGQAPVASVPVPYAANLAPAFLPGQAFWSPVVTSQPSYGQQYPAPPPPAQPMLGTYSPPQTQISYSQPQAQPSYSPPPTQVSYSPPPAQPGYAPPPTQAPFSPPPAQPGYATPPAQATFSPPPGQPGYAPPPAQPGYAPPPTQAPFSTPPGQPFYSPPPAQAPYSAAAPTQPNPYPAGAQMYSQSQTQPPVAVKQPVPSYPAPAPPPSPTVTPPPAVSTTPSPATQQCRPINPSLTSTLHGTTNIMGQNTGYWFSWTDKLNAQKSWIDAELFCRQNCMTLVSLDQTNKTMAVAAMVTKADLYGIWTSGRLCNYAGCEKDPQSNGKWMWATKGSKVGGDPSGKWSPTGPIKKTQPDNYSGIAGGENEECLALLSNWYNDGITYHDLPCSEVLPFICEKNL